MTDHRDLMAWQEAMKLAEMVYRVTDSFPSREMYGLTSQARRSAISIPSNIAGAEAISNSVDHFGELHCLLPCH